MNSATQLINSYTVKWIVKWAVIVRSLFPEIKQQIVFFTLWDLFKAGYGESRTQTSLIRDLWDTAYIGLNPPPIETDFAAVIVVTIEDVTFAFV